MNHTRVFRSAPAVTVATLLALTGCSGSSDQPATNSGGAGTRAELYTSVSALAADSSAVVEVEILSQEIGALDAPDQSLQTPLTLSTVRVLDVAAPAGLASALPNGPSQITPGDELVVRQIGTNDLAETPAPILTVGSSYLLFITPTTLPGDAADDYYVTGAAAGIFQPSTAARGTEQSFASVSHDGDILPSELTLSELGG